MRALIIFAMLLSACAENKKDYEKYCAENDYFCGKLGAYYYEKNDLANALKYFDKSCLDDNRDSCYDAAMVSEMLKDYKGAIKYYEKLESLGDVNAISKIADIYKLRGDFDKAHELYMQACEKKSREACLRLAKIYETGDHVRANKFIAQEYLKRAQNASRYY